MPISAAISISSSESEKYLQCMLQRRYSILMDLRRCSVELLESLAQKDYVTTELLLELRQDQIVRAEKNREEILLAGDTADREIRRLFQELMQPEQTESEKRQPEQTKSEKRLSEQMGPEKRKPALPTPQKDPVRKERQELYRIQKRLQVLAAEIRQLDQQLLRSAKRCQS